VIKSSELVGSGLLTSYTLICFDQKIRPLSLFNLTDAFLGLKKYVDIVIINNEQTHITE